MHHLSPGIYPLTSPPNNQHSWQNQPWGAAGFVSCGVMVVPIPTGHKEPQFCPKWGWNTSGKGIVPAFQSMPCSSKWVSLSPALALSKKQRILGQVMRATVNPGVTELL